MKVIHTINEIRKEINKGKLAGDIIGFVPTMGALHTGHEALIKTAAKQADFVVVSIFVNPTQFEPGSDFDAYPRMLDSDLQLCENSGVDLVFAPSVEQMYPFQQLTWINVQKLTENLCGEHRPGHFKGVATVCAKLFNIIQPDKAFFGQKDAQQLAVIKRMVHDLNFPLEIIACQTVREQDGLAISSRNKYLTKSQRKEAVLIYASLQLCQLLVEAGETDIKILKTEMEKMMTKGGNIKPEYIEFVDADTLDPIEKISGQVLVAVAAHLGKARLIDNIIL